MISAQTSSENTRPMEARDGSSHVMEVCASCRMLAVTLQIDKGKLG